MSFFYKFRIISIVELEYTFFQYFKWGQQFVHGDEESNKSNLFTQLHCN